MTTVMTSPQIRQGVLKDCKDILTIYQTTRWQEHRYVHVDEVKREHQGVFFRRWGWLVAEMNNRIIGEVIFRKEENPSLGTIGIIRSLDVDVRYQKHNVGRRLVREAEAALANRGVRQVVVNTAPEAYNFWMKLGYFSRHPLVVLEAEASRIANNRSRTFEVIPIREFYHVPHSIKYSNLAPAGRLADLAGLVLDGVASGGVYEIYGKDGLVGSTAFARTSDGTVEFAVDVTDGNESLLEPVAAKAATIAKRSRAKRVRTTIPKALLTKYEGIADWAIEDANLIPVTRLF